MSQCSIPGGIVADRVSRRLIVRAVSFADFLAITSVVVVGWAGLARGAWDPLGDARVLRLEVPCGCCAALTCPVAGHPCLDGISVDMVWDALWPLLA